MILVAAGAVDKDLAAWISENVTQLVYTWPRAPLKGPSTWRGRGICEDGLVKGPLLKELILGSNGEGPSTPM